MANTYTDAQITDALAALELNGGALRRTAREVNVPAPTLLNWRNQALKAEPLRPLNAPEQKERDFAALWADKEAKVLDLIGEKAASASFRDLSIFAGIAADKHMDYSIGRKGVAVNIDQSQHQAIILIE